MENRTMLEDEDRVDGSFDTVVGVGGSQPSKWKYAGHDILVSVREFFCGQRRTHRGHDTFTDVAETIILQESELSTEMLEISRKLLEQQRILENTHARRRLERWATRVISWYLIVVLVLVVSNGVTAMLAGNKEGFISSGIMAAILSTTTINIIGLGLIVLRGHFPQKESSSENNQ